MTLIHMDNIILAAHKAGKAILEIYQMDFTVENKDDNSPLTLADKVSHSIIVQVLQQCYPDIPMLSEEGKEIPYEVRKGWNRFWLVDPLDGTKEFIKRNGEFTVNIALIEDGYPVLGVIYAPILGTFYVGHKDKGTFKIEPDGKRIELHVKSVEENRYTIVESRSHPSQDLNDYVSKIGKRYKKIYRIEKGSSLKFCTVAEGLVDSYPRFGLTMEWDTAAGQAIVEAAGGSVLNLAGERISYNKESLCNDCFIVFSQEVLL